MNRLVDTVDTALAIRNTTQTGTGKQTQRSGDNTSFIANNITEQVASNNNTVQLTGVLDHEHSGRVNEVVTNGDLGVFLLHNLGDNLAPQTAGSEDIGLVQTPDGQGRVVLQSEVGGETDDALDLLARVGLSVHGVSGAIVLLALTKVDTARQLADDVEVNAAADVGLERRALDQRGRSEVAGPQVAECAHFLAQLEDTLFWAHGAGAPFLLVRMGQ